jgi:gluconate 2-dehydrogenase gamma chain
MDEQARRWPQAALDGAVPSRRDFISSSAGMFGGGWLWLNLPVVTALSACARDAARHDEPFAFLSPVEGRVMRAFAARIIPTGPDSPGAEESGAAWFADAALAGPFDGMADPVRGGLADLEARARAAYGVGFAGLGPAQQDALIEEVLDTPFFFLGRMLVVMGVFSDPAWGGGRADMGHTLLGMDHAPAYRPPFGWYDAEHVRLHGNAGAAGGAG